MGMIQTLDDSLLQDLQTGAKDKSRFLFVEQHPRFSQHLLVNSYDRAFTSRVKAVSAVRIPEASPTSDENFVVTPFGSQWKTFKEEAANQGFEIVYMPGTQEYIDSLIAKVNTVPEVSINSSMPDTINGFLKFQVQGFNMLKDEEAGWLDWSTGTGKTVGAAGLTKYHQDKGNFDVSIWCVKAHNKQNTVRALDALVGIKAIIVHGTKAKRAKQYAEIAQAMARGERPVAVVNYEAFRGDTDYFKALVQGHKVMMVWDEAPTKLRNRRTKLWNALYDVLYTPVLDRSTGEPQKAQWPDPARRRAAEMRVYVTSATPIENSPQDFFNVIRLMAPKALGSAKQFDAQHVIWGTMQIVGRGGRIITTKVVQGYRNLDQIGIKVAHMRHSVDKHDADIAAMFPKVLNDEIIIDLSDHQQKLYNKLANRYSAVIKKFADMQKGHSMTDEDKRELMKLRAVFTVLQMIVDDPALVLESAETFVATKGEEGSEVANEFRAEIGDDSQFEDNGEETRVAKLEALRELIEDNDEKVVAYTTHGAPFLNRVSAWLTKWEIDHVIYHGSMSLTQKQAAEDRFKSDPNCKLFLSSDAGSDSINLQVSDLAVHIDLPWKPSTFEQRENRIHRITSGFDHVRVVTLMTETLPEEHKAEILDTKRSYQRATLKSEAANISAALREMED